MADANSINVRAYIHIHIWFFIDIHVSFQKPQNQIESNRNNELIKYLNQAQRIRMRKRSAVTNMKISGRCSLVRTHWKRSLWCERAEGYLVPVPGRCPLACTLASVITKVKRRIAQSINEEIYKRVHKTIYIYIIYIHIWLCINMHVSFKPAE